MTFPYIHLLAANNEAIYDRKPHTGPGREEQVAAYNARSRSTSRNRCIANYVSNCDRVLLARMAWIGNFFIHIYILYALHVSFVEQSDADCPAIYRLQRRYYCFIY